MSSEASRVATGAKTPIAVIDIGSNSLFMMIVQPRGDGTFDQLARHKVTARLGTAIERDGNFDCTVIDSTASALARFASIAAVWGAEVNAVATAAVRRSGNGRELVDAIAARSGITVRLLGGHQEASLAFKGAHFGGVAGPGAMLCADVGGGSTELAWGQKSQPTVTASAPLGAVTLSRSHLHRELVSVSDLAGARAHVASKIAGWETTFRACAGIAVATSGTIQRVGRIVAQTVDSVEGLDISATDIRALVERLRACNSHDERRRIPAMDPERADILLAGCLIFDELGRQLGVSRWRISVAGLRTGVAVDAMAALGLGVAR